jgi:hypothetical protein
MNDEQVQVLNFSAKLLTKNSDDLRRKFVVSFYLFDQTLQIYEELVPNSGFRHGKYLQKTRVINPTTRQFFAPSDFFVGGRINVGGRIFELTGASELAYGIMESNPDEFRESDLALQLSKLTTTTQVTGTNLRQAFTEAEKETPEKKLTVAAAQRILERCAPNLSRQGAATIARGYDRRETFATEEFLGILRL